MHRAIEFAYNKMTRIVPFLPSLGMFRARFKDISPFSAFMIAFLILNASLAYLWSSIELLYVGATWCILLFCMCKSFDSLYAKIYSNIVFLVCVSVVVLIGLSVFYILLSESVNFFMHVSALEFFTSTEWDPYYTEGGSGSFGSLGVFWGSFFIAFIAMALAVPLGVMSAVYLTYYTPRYLQEILSMVLNVLTGIPTVVYGLLGILLIEPMLTQIAMEMGYGEIVSGTALAAGITLSLLVLPIVIVFTRVALLSLPAEYEMNSYALGVNKSRTIMSLLLRVARPGIAGGVLIATSRAMGETMIVAMVGGLVANASLNPLKPTTTVTVQIMNLLSGDQSFDSPQTMAAFALGLTLFCIMLVLNAFVLKLIEKSRAINQQM